MPQPHNTCPHCVRLPLIRLLPKQPNFIPVAALASSLLNQCTIQEATGPASHSPFAIFYPDGNCGKFEWGASLTLKPLNILQSE